MNNAPRPLALAATVPAITCEEMRAQDVYWTRLAFRAGWALGNHGAVKGREAARQATRLMRELDRSLCQCLHGATRLDAVEYFDAIVESGRRGELTHAA